MINSDIEVSFSTKHLPFEYKLIEFRLKINTDLYNEGIISYEVFKDMENILLSRLNKIQNESLNSVNKGV